MTASALTPFSRGANAPLSGRTILQLVPPLATGGDERGTLAVASALIEAGARALVASDADELASELQALGGLFVPFPVSTKNPLAMTFHVRRLVRILDSEHVDLVHARSLSAAWVALGACRKRNRPLVTTFQGEGPASPPRSSFESAVANGDRAIASSQYAADRAAEIFPAALARLRLVRPGLDLSKLSPEAISRERVAKVREGWGAAPHERVVLAPARLTADRGPKLLVEAAAILKGRGLGDVRFVLGGDAAKPAYLREIDAFAAERGVKSIVSRLSAPEDRAAAFVAASAIAFPANEADGITRASIEAAAMGALAILSDVGQAREIVAAPPYSAPEERSGWLVPPRNAAALADAVEAALSLGASAREAIRRRSRARIAAYFSLERMKRDTLGVYAEALQLRGS